jgi:hypothetical protein
MPQLVREDIPELDRYGRTDPNSDGRPRRAFLLAFFIEVVNTLMVKGFFKKSGNILH